MATSSQLTTDLLVSWMHLPLLIDELPQTVTIKENISPAPGEATVKVETLDSQESQAEGGTSSPQLPPPSVIIKSEVKKEEPGEVNGKENEDEEEEDSDRPFSKMTMRLRRNISNPQCVSWQKEIVKHKYRPVITFLWCLYSLWVFWYKNLISFVIFFSVYMLWPCFLSLWCRWTHLFVGCVVEERMMRSCCSVTVVRIITTPIVYYLPWLTFPKETGDAPSALQR